MKIIDGFITNSSTQTTTILLAVKKGKELYSILESLGYLKNYPMDFFNFTRNEKEIEEFSKIHQVNLTFLEKYYELFINTIPDWGEQCETDMDIEKRWDQMSSLVKDIKTNATDDILVLFYGDILHNGYHFNPPILYSKQEIFSIFKSENKKLINSIIENNILKQLDLNKEELIKLQKSLKIPLKEILSAGIIEKDPYQLIQFKPLYYHFFGEQYIDLILEFILTDYIGTPYFSIDILKMNINLLMRLSNLSRTKLKKKLKKLVKKPHIDDKINEFFDLITIIKEFLGDEELLLFLNSSRYINLFFKSHLAGIMKREVIGLVAHAILNIYKKGDKNMRNIAENIHYMLMEVLKSLLKMELKKTRFHPLIIVKLIEPYFLNNQELLLIPSIISIGRENLSNYIKTLKNDYHREYFKRLERLLENEDKKHKKLDYWI